MNDQNLVRNEDRTPEERRENARKAGIASGKARRKKADMRKLLEQMMKEDIPDGSMTYAERVTLSLLTVASNPKYGGAMVNAYKQIAHITGQDEPEQKQEDIEVLRKILALNRKYAEAVQPEQETE